MAEDDLEPLVTECPHCATRFRVTEVQLASAGGKVRCGACLNVFQGADQLVFGSAALPGDAGDLDDLLAELDRAAAAETLDDPDEPAAVTARPRWPLANGPEWPHDANDEAADESSRADDDPEVEWLLADDESADEPLLIDDESADEPLLTAEAPAHQGAIEPAGEPFVGAPAGVRVPLVAGGADEVVEELADEAEIGGDLPLPEVAVEESDPFTEETSDEPATDPAWFEDDDEEPHPGDAVASTDALAVAAALVERANAPPVETEGNVRVQPVVVPRRAPVLEDLLAEQTIDAAGRTRRRWVAGLAVLGVVALAAQVAWYQKDRWLADRELRPWFERACERLGCDLPLLREPESIEARELVVRAHPEVERALVVDALVINRAPFPQAYPVIELTFSDVNGRVIAQRGFEPGEYLAGELAGSKRFVPATPIHIALEIEDPGEAAVNYRMTFR